MGLRPEYDLSPVVSQYLSTVQLHGCAHHEEMGIVRIEDVAFTLVRLRPLCVFEIVTRVYWGEEP